MSAPANPSFRTGQLAKLRGKLTLAASLALAACDLAVSNPNDPETTKVLKTELETLIGTQYLRAQQGVYPFGGLWAMAAVQAFENFSALNNVCMAFRIGIPRPANDNSFNNGCAADQVRVFNVEHEVVRTASNVLKQLADTLREPRFTLGSPAQDARARAFAEFVRALALGYLGLMYDSAAVVTPVTDREDPASLRGYLEVMDSALAGLQRAVEQASMSVGGLNGFPLPGNWIPSPTSFTAAEFIKLVRSYKARFRATVARNPTERAAVDWSAVIADAQNGLTADHLNNTGTGTGGAMNGTVAQFQNHGVWHQMPPFLIGMADTSGSYANWLGLPLVERGAGNVGFLMSTPDLRWPQGSTRAAQQADFALATSCSSAGAVCKRYFVNRPDASDSYLAPSWGWSNYDFVRFYPWRRFGGAVGLTELQGPLIFFTKAEVNLLEAEGHFRLGNYAAAATLINLTRVPNGLPAITAFDPSTPVPGGNACVPRMPVNASLSGGGTVTCANLMEALKYEKRLETLQTSFASWYLDGRGWGDFVEGTPVHWPVPFQEILARGGNVTRFYNTGGVGNLGGAGRSVYGW